METTRQMIESNVIGYNRHLKTAVKTMELLPLLRNAHPIDRQSFARQLFREGKISEKELKEFQS